MFKSAKKDTSWREDEEEPGGMRVVHSLSLHPLQKNLANNVPCAGSSMRKGLLIKHDHSNGQFTNDFKEQKKNKKQDTDELKTLCLSYSQASSPKE